MADTRRAGAGNFHGDLIVPFVYHKNKTAWGRKPRNIRVVALLGERRWEEHVSRIST